MIEAGFVEPIAELGVAVLGRDRAHRHAADDRVADGDEPAQLVGPRGAVQARLEVGEIVAGPGEPRRTVLDGGGAERVMANVASLRAPPEHEGGVRRVGRPWRYAVSPKLPPA
jgi:hypothetical protein